MLEQEIEQFSPVRAYSRRSGCQGLALRLHPIGNWIDGQNEVLRYLRGLGWLRALRQFEIWIVGQSQAQIAAVHMEHEILGDKVIQCPLHPRIGSDVGGDIAGSAGIGTILVERRRTAFVLVCAPLSTAAVINDDVRKGFTISRQSA